jgi:hypothetical protein
MKAGGVDVENLWITSQRLWLPTLWKREMDSTLQAKLDAQLGKFPAVLRACIKEAADGAPKRTILAIALFGRLHHRRRIPISGQFENAGYDVYDPHQDIAMKKGQPLAKCEPMKDEADIHMQTKIAFLASSVGSIKDTHFVLGTSDHFAAALAQSLLSETDRTIVVLNHRANSRPQRKRLFELSKAVGPRLKVVSLEDLPPYQAYVRECLDLDPHHTFWKDQPLRDKLIGTATLRVYLRDKKVKEDATRDSGQRARPIAEWELKQWIQGWIENWNTYNSLAGMPQHSNQQQDRAAAYELLLKEGVIAEIIDPSLMRGKGKHVVLPAALSQKMRVRIDAIQKAQHIYELEHHAQS